MPNKFPDQYLWLKSEPGPKILKEAVNLYGTIEVPGQANNPFIMGWAKELGLQATYTGDEIPWCGLFAAVCAHRAGYKLPDKPLWALSWTNWGNPVEKPMLGDILTFKRPGGGGHVGLYVGEDVMSYHVLGGNQSDAVTVTRISRSRFHKARRSPFELGQPDNVRSVILSQTGKLSANEA